MAGGPGGLHCHKQGAIVGGGVYHNNNNRKVQNGGGNVFGVFSFGKKGESRNYGSQNKVFTCIRDGPKMPQSSFGSYGGSFSGSSSENAGDACFRCGGCTNRSVACWGHPPKGSTNPPTKGGRTHAGRTGGAPWPRHGQNNNKNKHERTYAIIKKHTAF